MKFLLDTDVVIDHLRGVRSIPLPNTNKGLSISIITLGELYYGAEKSVNKQKSIDIITDFINDLAISILNLNERVMKEYAVIKAKLELRGERLDDFDLLIAATAKTYKSILITRNTKHFKRISGISLHPA